VRQIYPKDLSLGSRTIQNHSIKENYDAKNLSPFARVDFRECTSLFPSITLVLSPAKVDEDTSLVDACPQGLDKLQKIG
jgi:hypothetical protein